MKHSVIQLLGVLVMLVCMSCSTSNIAIDVLKPAKNSVDTTIVQLGIASRVATEDSSVPLALNGVEVEDMKKSLRFSIEEGLSALDQGLTEVGRYDPILIKYGALGFGDESTVPTGLITICNAYRLDAVLSMNRLEAFVDVDKNVALSSPVDRNYGTVRVPVFQSMQQVEWTTHWELYSCNSATSLLKQSVRTDFASEQRSENPDEVVPRLGQMQGNLLDVARKNARQMQPFISPYWVTVNRVFYAYGSMQIVEAANLAQDGFWQEATDIWFDLTKSERKSTAKKATYNMILASEVSGDYELAINWAQKSIDLFNDRLAATYLLKLEARKAEIDRLNAQFPSVTN